MQAIKKIYLDVYGGYSGVRVYVKGHDANSRAINVVLCSGSSAVTIPSNATIVLGIDGKGYAGSVLEDGSVLIVLPLETVCTKGTYKCDVSAVYDNAKLTSADFEVIVNEPKFDGSEMEEDVESILVRILTETASAREQAESARTQAENAQTQASNAKTQADYAKAQGDMAQASALEAQTQSESARTQAENAQTKAELANQAADRANATIDLLDGRAFSLTRNADGSVTLLFDDLK